jgi:hypothetical protein
MVKLITSALLGISVFASSSGFAADHASKAIVETVGPASITVVEIGVPPAKRTN